MRRVERPLGTRSTPGDITAMIAVITGSSGFIGTHLVHALLARGATVRALVRPESASDARNPRVEYWQADLLDDRSVRESPIWADVTHVFHLAGVTTGRTLAHFRAGNVFPTANVLAAIAARSGPPPRVVLVSSLAAAGPAKGPNEPVRETDRPMPIEAYGRSKLQAEQAVVRYRDVLPVSIVRPAAVYGPRDGDFLKAFKQASRRVALHAVSQDHAFSLVHVSDLVAALMLAAERPEAVGRTYFIANGEPITWRELYDQVADAAGSHPIQLQIPRPAVWLASRAGDLMSALTGRVTMLNKNKAALARPRWWLCDARAARDDLGWQPRVGLQTGVRDTYLWYVEAGWLRPPKPAVQAAPQESKE